MAEETRFLDMFGCCAPMEATLGGVSDAVVRNVLVSRETRSMQISAYFPAPVSPGDLAALEMRIASEYGLSSVRIAADFPHEEKKSPEKKKEKPKTEGDALMGKPPKEASTPIGELTLESGTVVVSGKVFLADSREIPKNNAAVLSFSITDYTGSIHVSKYLRNKEDQEIIQKINVGDYLTVRGNIVFNRYENDMALEPTAIVPAEAPRRKDRAEGEKRVELHLHTRFSTLDALTDPADAVKTAKRWGHRAVAVTDHGTAQAFPDIWKAGKKNEIKVIYGIEGYYINDVDDLPAIHGLTDRPLLTDFVGFDIETTGLDCSKNRITEIGAVRIRDGKITETFQTFVDPEMPIPPEVVQLTGITDRDVFGAPSEAEAVRDFLAFAGELPLVAHNAAFDIGFITAAAEKHAIPFAPVYVDTLAVSQALLKDLKRYKLDIVSRALGLPDFNHHRASDDAAVCARIFLSLREQLSERGVTNLQDVGRVCDELRTGHENRRTRHIILLVQNKVGLKNLYELISKSYLEHFHKNPIIPKSLLMQYREGILIGSACEAGEVFDAVVRRRSDAELTRLASFYDYLEIQPLCNNRFMIADGKAKDDEELRDFNRRIVALGKKLGKPVCATGDVHFLNPEDEIYRRILLASKKFADADKDMPIYFKTTDEMLEEFSYLGKDDCRDVVITAPNAIADSVEEFELLPKGLFAPKIENSAEELKKLVYDKMHRIYGENPPEIVQSRVDVELTTILEHEYDVIYMSAQKLVQNSLEHGYLVGSRGSVGSSIVAYMSGITEVNSLPPHYVCPQCCHSEFITDGSYGCGADMPEKDCPVCGKRMRRDGFGIPFETFLGFPGNAKTPDIDLNFSGEYQSNAHKYTETLFGSDHVFRAGTIGTLAEKTAFGYVKKYLEERGVTVSKAEENRLAAGCVGVKRTTGQHPGGLVVIPQDKDVTDFCPVQHPADDPTSDIITTHFEYHCMEDNLLKLDELGHDDPTMIRQMEDMTGVDAKEISLSDPETMSIFTSPAALGLPDDDPIIGKTGTLGVPEFGTKFTRQMLVDTQPKQFDTLIRLSGFSHGTDVWAGNIHDLIVNGIADVNETIGCRDDIMQYLISVGMEPSLAFKTMEMVRKGKVKKSGEFPGDAEEQMRKLGVPDWYIESARKIAYLFPKAHAVAYVMMAFRIAWFKVHEPLAYYSAYFYRRSQKDGFDAESMLMGIDKCREKIRAIERDPNPSAKDEDLLTTLEAVYEFYLRGFRFAPIDLYKSEAYKFVIEDGMLRPPFVAISGLGGAAAEDLAACRKSGRQFISIDDISDACPKVSQAHLEMLRKMGALGDLPESRQVSLFDGFM